MANAETPLWEPSASLAEGSRLFAFQRWLERERGLRFDGYTELWRWSVDDVEGFWAAIWDFFEVMADGEQRPVLGSREMPGAEWFGGVALNYAEHVFRGRDAEATAILHASEAAPLATVSWRELSEEVGAIAAALRAMGVGRGDRVVGYLPNVPEAVVAFLATVSLGAIWSSCSPDFGSGAVIDRFDQIEPKVLFAVDSYRYGGRLHDRREALADLRAAMPSLTDAVMVPAPGGGDAGASAPGEWRWAELLAAHRDTEPVWERVPFDHPLWVLYSSGTTGLPKAIVHGHGGILLEHLKTLGLHFDARPGEPLFWFTTTGWMVWNLLVSGLLVGAPIVLYDGNPAHPDLGALWELAAQARIGIFGTSAAYLSACMKDGLEPAAGRDLGALRALGSTGSPLSPEGFDWVYEQLGDVWLFSTSGGTDVCAPFLGGVPLLPVYRGELQGPALGVALQAWNREGEPVVGEVGELVVTEPLPSMPVCFWGDEDGSRYRESYFEVFPGVWRHGDWLELNERGGGVIHGRSDSTINRGGVRMGTAEIYRAVLSVDQVVDALVVDLPRVGTPGWMPLFVVLREGIELDDALRAEIARRVRERCSPRHVPDEIRRIDAVPRTLSGKVLEVPVKRILTGTPAELAASRDSLANPAALGYFQALAAELAEAERGG